MWVKQLVEYCEESGKVRYDKRTAVTAANKRYNDSHERLRIYACPHCQRTHGERCWHLTSLRAQKEHDT